MSCHAMSFSTVSLKHWPVCRVVNMHLGVSICSFFHLLVWDFFSTQATKNFHKFLLKCHFLFKKNKNANFVPKTFTFLPKKADNSRLVEPKNWDNKKLVFWTNRHPWLGLGWPDLHQFNAPTSNVYKGSVPTPNVCNITSNICKGSANTISNVCNITSNICKCSTNVTSNVYIFKCCRWPFSVLFSTNSKCL